jgi:hypothetical protein
MVVYDGINAGHLLSQYMSGWTDENQEHLGSECQSANRDSNSEPH